MKSCELSGFFFQSGTNVAEHIKGSISFDISAAQPQHIGSMAETLNQEIQIRIHIVFVQVAMGNISAPGGKQCHIQAKLLCNADNLFGSLPVTAIQIRGCIIFIFQCICTVHILLRPLMNQGRLNHRVTFFFPVL